MLFREKWFLDCVNYTPWFITWEHRFYDKETKGKVFTQPLANSCHVCLNYLFKIVSLVLPPAVINMSLIILVKFIGALKPAVLVNDVLWLVVTMIACYWLSIALQWGIHSIWWNINETSLNYRSKSADDGTKEIQGHRHPRKEAEDATLSVNLLGLEVLGDRGKIIHLCNSLQRNALKSVL